MDYSKHAGTRETPQSEPIPGSTQVANSAGGFTWAVDDWVRLDRFLLLGAEGGTYYIGERKLTQENAQAVARCVKADGARTIRHIVDVSRNGRAPKNDPAIFALALAASHGDAATKALALGALPQVCRIGTHLFHFAQAVQAFRGWGRGLRRAVGRWYTADADANNIAYQAIKYQQRDGWTHRDLLRLAHPKPPTAAHDALFRWMTKGETSSEALPRLVTALEELKRADSAKAVAALVEAHDLPREAVEAANTKWLSEVVVWEALLKRMPMTAMVRSLARMTTLGLLAPLSEASKHVVNELGNVDRIRRSRLHPIALLSAQRVYARGHGERGKLAWAPVGQIIDALDAAFYAAFENAPSTGKRLVLALDVSGSMASGTIAGIQGLAPRDVAAALALVTAAREPNHAIMAFGATFVPLNITPRMRLADAIRATSDLDFDRTDCALPMLWAIQNRVDADGFVVLTDNETWAGRIHPSQALVHYRQTRGLNAKSVVVGMVSNGFSIADPNDAGMLDIVGCDTATPNLIADFVSR
jgi:60 kDa SS-A/Ro ribonucleoprotein